MLYFEDVPVGFRRTEGPLAATAAEIVGFANQWDPRPIHVDPEAARATPWLHGAGLIGSGLHTLAIWAKLLERATRDIAFTVGAGFDEVRFVRPLLPGVPLLFELECIAQVPSKSRPDRGLLRTRNRLLDPDGEIVMHMVCGSFCLRRPAAA